MNGYSSEMSAFLADPFNPDWPETTKAKGEEGSPCTSSLPLSPSFLAWESDSVLSASSPPSSVVDLESLVGETFTSEIESVSRTFEHYDTDPLSAAGPSDSADQLQSLVSDCGLLDILPPSEEALVSEHALLQAETPLLPTSPDLLPTSPDLTELQSLPAGELSDPEEQRMIDQALQDLQTLEASLCDAAPEEPAAPAAPSPCPPAASVQVKQEPADDQEVQIVEERPPQQQRGPRQRKTKVAVTPGRADVQIIIVLTEQQLQEMQRTAGKLMLDELVQAASGVPAKSAKKTPSATATKPTVSVIKPPASPAVTVTKPPASVIKPPTSPAATVTQPASSPKPAISTGASVFKSPSSPVLRRARSAVPTAVRKAAVSTVVRVAGRSSAGRTIRFVPRGQKPIGKDPLSTWTTEKLPPQCWDFPLVAPSALQATQQPPAPPLLLGNSAEPEALLPDDLQDLFLDSADVAVPALPGDDANSLLDDLISSSVKDNPSLFSAESGGGALEPALRQPGPASSGGAQSLEPTPSPTLSPDPVVPQLVSMDAWLPTPSPSLHDPFSPCGSESTEPPLDADWSPMNVTPPGKRRQGRPKPYDKPAAAGRSRHQLTEEERRQRKKEQNKNAATRYRQKKKEEMELVAADEEELERNNKQLRERVASLTKELTYLKQLMREVLRHKRAV